MDNGKRNQWDELWSEWNEGDRLKEVTWNAIIEADNVTTEQVGWLYYDVI